VRFDTPLTEGRLIRRYKRFLADVETAAGTVVAHCPNTGSMLGCAEPGSRVWLRPAADARRKLAFTWELVESGGTLVGINTGRSNRLVEEAIAAGAIPELCGYLLARREAAYAGRASRCDLLLEREGRLCYVEVKSVTAAVDAGIAVFPDAVSERAARHLEEMMRAVRGGHRAVLIYCVQRADVREVRPADTIDPVYGRALRRAESKGVEVLAYRARVSPEEITLEAAVATVCPPPPRKTRRSSRKEPTR
jgi:sugar fermentation stimulation protein A